MNNLFGPILGGSNTALQQAQGSRDMLIDMFRPKTNINPDDPDSLRKEAARLMADGQTEAGIRMNEMAHAVTARQEEGRANNIYATLGQVEGTKQEAQVREALIKAGRAGDIAKYDQEKMQEEMNGIKYDDARMGALSKKALAQYRSARTPEAKKAVIDDAIAGGHAQHIEAFIEKEQENAWKEQDRVWTIQQRKQQAMEQTAKSVPLKSDPSEIQKQLQQADQAGYGDILRQRYINRNEYRTSSAAARAMEQSGTIIFTEDDEVLKDAGVPIAEYELRARSIGRDAANRWVLDQAATNRSKKITTPKTPTDDEVTYWETYLDDMFDTGWTDFSGGIDNANVDTKMWAYEIANAAKNGTPPSETLKRLLGEGNTPEGLENVSEEDAQVWVQGLLMNESDEMKAKVQEARALGATWAEIYGSMQ